MEVPVEDHSQTVLDDLDEHAQQRKAVETNSDF